MNPRIDEAALAAAGADGPNPPPIDRLRVAAEHALACTNGKQLILFGSAARGEFTPESDFDFLVIHETDQPKETRKRVETDKLGSSIDIAQAGRPEIEKHGRTAGNPLCHFMSEGLTLTKHEERPLVETLRDRGLTPTDAAEKTPESVAMAARIGSTILSGAVGLERAIGKEAWQDGCILLARAVDASLRCILTANGYPRTFIHPIPVLWNEAEKVDGEIPVERDDALLNEISLYDQHRGCLKKTRMDQEELCKRGQPLVRELSSHAHEREEALAKEYNQQQLDHPGDEIPIRPSSREPHRGERRAKVQRGKPLKNSR